MDKCLIAAGSGGYYAFELLDSHLTESMTSAASYQ